MHAALHSPAVRRSRTAVAALLDPYSRVRRTQSLDTVHDHWVAMESSPASDVRAYPLLGCVVKRVCLSGVAPHEAARMVEEGALLARLRHRNIVAVWTWFCRGGVYTLVTQHVRGHDLYDHIVSLDEPPAWPAALGVVRQVVDALAYCHALGVAHGDVKPENIVVTRDGGVKLIDFGLAMQCTTCPPTRACELARDFRLRVVADPLGTQQFRAPEVASGFYNPFAADVWAACHTFAVLITLQDVTRARGALEHPPPGPSAGCRERARILQGMALAPTHRPTVFDLRRTLKAEKNVGTT
jgi:serine/threonine protein kinase